MKLAERDVESVFYSAMELNTPAEREAYLDQACGDDTDFRRRIEKLLAAHHQAGSFLEAPSPAPAATTDDPLSERPGTVIGPYKLLEQIGEGGFGVVFLAEQTHPVRRKVALKILKAGMDTRQVVARFEAERQALAIMDHPNIAKVFDGGMTGLPIDDCRLPIDGGVQGIQSAIANRQSAISSGRPYFVMELVKGRPITDHCDKDELSLRQRLELFVPVCQAVQHAHQKGIIHRDLKPSNVLVTPPHSPPSQGGDTRGVPKVIDFGVAKALGQELTDKTLHTAMAQMIGTPLYMSPEQAGEGNLDVDTRSDVYSLGVLLYELLTGTTPFEKERFKKAHIDEIRRIIREEEPPKPSTRLSSPHAPRAQSATRSVQTTLAQARLLRGELDWIVMKCLEKDRNRRYETASGFAMDIQRYLANEPVLAGPPSARYRLRKFVRRNKGPVIAAVLMVTIFLVGIVGTTWGLVLAIQARDAEAKERGRAENAEADAKRERDVALEQQRRADNQAALARAVADFLQDDLLLQADPNEQSDRVLRLGQGFEARANPTIKELLDRAATELTPEKIDTKFPQQPLVQAEILRTVGNAYLGIGQYDKAITHLARSSDLYEQTLGVDEHDTLNARHDLALAYWNAGQTAEAIARFEHLRDVFVATLGPDHEDTLTTHYNLAGAYQDAGRTTEAIALFERVRDAQVTQFGWNHASTFNTVTALAWAQCHAGKASEAITLLQRIRDAQVATLGPKHHATLTTLNVMAVACRHAGKIDQAITLLQEVRDARLAALGATHPTTLSTLNNLAVAYRHAGKPVDAIELLNQVRDPLVAKLGPDHPDTLSTLNNLAAAHRDAGNTNEAIALFEHVRDAHARQLGPDHPNALNTRNNLAVAYLSAGRTAEATALFEQIRDAQAAKLGAQHPATLNTLANLAAAYLVAGKLPAAIALFEQVRDVETRTLGPRHPGTLTTLSNLAAAYRDAGRVVDAATVFEQVRAIQAMELGRDHLDTLATSASLAHAYLLQKKFAAAEPILRECLEGRERKEPDFWTTFNTRSLLGGALLGQGKLAEAEQLLVQGYEGIKERQAKMPPHHKVRLTEALARLVQLYDDLGKKDDAEKWRRELEIAERNANPDKK